VNIPDSLETGCPTVMEPGTAQKAVGMKGPGLRANFTGKDYLFGLMAELIKVNGNAESKMVWE